MLEEHDLTGLVIKIENQNKFLKKELSDYKKLNDSQKDEIIKLKSIIQYERMKIIIYTNIINSLTDIKLDDIIEENEESVNIYNHDMINIPIIVNNFFKGKKPEEIDEKTRQYSINIKKKRTKPVYRSTKQSDNITENPLEEEKKIEKIEKEREHIMRENDLDISYNETKKQIEKCFEDIKIARTYKKHLTNLRDLRRKLLGKFTIDEYIEVINNHIKNLQEIFKKKKYEIKKCTEYISLSLSPLEQRLIYFEKYYESQLITDDIQKFIISIELNMNYPKRYIPFSYTEILKKFFNYSMVICSIKENLKRVLVNPYGFSNLIYLNNEKSLIEDRYSFYILENIDNDGKKLWKLEIRLDEFSKTLSKHLLQYLIDMFRKIYYDVFNDNIYRKNYKEKSIILSEDCEQILSNIVILSKTKTFCNILRDIIAENSTFKPSKLDKFNLISDDKVSKRNFAQDNDQKDVIENSFKRIFDNINTEEINEIITNY
jgi:hypothetical protein